MYNHWRIGRGSRFCCYKFRTMYVDADKNKPEDTIFRKQASDSRILASKGWMRRIGFDELPQLLNVLKGDMVLFGARPLVESDWNQLTNTQQNIRLKRKPGCLGPYAMLRNGKNEDNLLRANDAYLHLLFKKQRAGNIQVIILNAKVTVLTIKAILQGKVK